MNKKTSIKLCGSLAFPFDYGTSLFVFIPLSLFRLLVGNLVLGSHISRERNVHFKSEEIKEIKKIIKKKRLRKSLAQLQKASFLPLCVHTQDVGT